MVGFSKNDALRVATSTRYVERMLRNDPTRGKGPTPSASGHYAKITGTDTDRTTGKYSWVAVEWKYTHLIEENSKWGEVAYDAEPNVNYAIERNFSKQIPIKTNEIVWLEAQNGPQPYFIFDYDGTMKNGITTTTISPRSSDIPGSGSWKVYKYDATYNAFTSDVLDTVIVKNPFATTITTNKRIQCVFNQGVWWLVSAEC